MSNYQVNQEKIVNRIMNEISRFDESDSKYISQPLDGRSQRIREWYETKKALHEIKKILKYSNMLVDYDEYGAENELKELEYYINRVTRYNY